MIVIFSSPRSGSTWLGKIFDSHPDVFYLHEPEIVDRGLDLLPHWFEAAPSSEQVAAARIYLDRMMTARSPRTTGTRPFFAKRYRSGIANACRQTLTYLAKGSERAGFRRYSDRIRIPDLIDRGGPMVCVIKLVSALGRAEVLIKAANSDMRPIMLIRHPCAYVGSMLRGEKIGAMKAIPPLGALANTRSAKRMGVNQAMLSRADDVEKLAWEWLLSNAEAYPAIRAAGGPIMVYETLAADTLACARSLFSQVGIAWAPETERFLLRSSSGEGGYYSVFRDPAKAANRWREELSETVVARVEAIVTRDPVGKLFFAA